MIYNLLKNSLINMWPSLVIISVALITVRLFYLQSHKEPIKFYKEFWTYVGIVYMLLLYELVTRVDFNYNSGVNLIPFTEIFRYEIPSKLFYFNVLGNIFLFIPFGFIIASYIKPKKIWPNLFIAIIVSVTIEFVQVNIGRSFDIDDIILNTLGCLLGYIVYVAHSAILKHLPKIFRKEWFNNLVCVIIIAVIFLYILKLMGVIV